MITKSSIERASALAKDPVFEKPYPRPKGEPGKIILVTKIKPNGCSGMVQRTT